MNMKYTITLLALIIPATIVPQNGTKASVKTETEANKEYKTIEDIAALLAFFAQANENLNSLARTTTIKSFDDLAELSNHVNTIIPKLAAKFPHDQKKQITTAAQQLYDSYKVFVTSFVSLEKIFKEKIEAIKKAGYYNKENIAEREQKYKAIQEAIIATNKNLKAYPFKKVDTADQEEEQYFDC
jgi:hypothetical protein